MPCWSGCGATGAAPRATPATRRQGVPCGVVFAGKPTWSAEDPLIADEVNCTRCRAALGLEPFSREERLARRRSRRN
jgi:hypothetical protein